MRCKQDVGLYKVVENTRAIFEFQSSEKGNL